jgi:hypothetical protein
MKCRYQYHKENHLLGKFSCQLSTACSVVFDVLIFILYKPKFFVAEFTWTKS